MAINGSPSKLWGILETFIRTDKIYHHPDRLFTFRTGGTVKPVTVEMHLTNRCNINCYYCMYKDRCNSLEMTTDDAKSVIDRLSGYGVKGITFSGGGEPTVHKDCTEILKYAKVKADVGLITNGVKFDSEVLNYLIWVRFSVDAASPEVYQKIKGKPYFNRVIENITRAVRYRNNKALPVTIGFQSVITEANYFQLSAMANLAELIGVDYFQYRPVERGAKQNKPALPKKDYKIRIIDSWYKWNELSEVDKYTECPGADFIGAVGADYNFYMCCHHVGDSSASYGNILTDPILSSRKQVQDRFDYSKCPIACRGAVINQRLKVYNNIEHVNFL